MAGKRRLDITGIIKSEEKFNKIQDLDILLECILSEACLSVNADAGSIYVVEGNMLSIRYSRNDTKQKDLPPGEKMIYSFFSFARNGRLYQYRPTQFRLNIIMIFNTSPKDAHAFTSFVFTTTSLILLKYFSLSGEK